MKLRISTCLILILFSATAAFAEATPAAQEWLQKVQGLDGRAFRVDYRLELGGTIFDAPVNATATGDYLRGGPRLSVNNMEVKADMAQDGGEPMEVSSRQVSDGSTMWVETHLVSMGMTQLGKIDIEALEKIQAERSGLSIDQSMMFSDPVSMIGQFSEAFDIDVAGKKDGKVTLSLAPTEKTRKMIGSELPDADLGVGRLTIDAETGAPISMEIEMGEGFQASIVFTNFELLGDGDIPEGTFAFEIPEGAQVMDLTPMLQSGM